VEGKRSRNGKKQEEFKNWARYWKFKNETRKVVNETDPKLLRSFTKILKHRMKNTRYISLPKIGKGNQEI